MKLKKRIIISSYDDLKNPHYGGGGARSIHSVARKLSSLYEVTVLTASYPGAKDETLDGVKYKRIALPLGGPKFSQLLYQLALPYHVITGKFDLWVESFTPPFSTTCLQLFTRKPVVGLVHMLSAEDMQRKYKLPFKLIENIGLKFYKYFIVLNKESKDKISLSNSKARFFVISNGVDLPVKTKKTDTTPGKVKKHILFMGRVEVNQKGLDLLLEAYKLIAGKIKLPLLIVGTGEINELKKLKSLVTKMKLAQKIKLGGRLNGIEWEKAYRNADSVVISSRYETYPMVALEAMAFNVPVVSFDIEGLKWLPSRVSLKAKMFDTDDLSRKIFEINKDQILRKKLLKNSSLFIKNHTWEKIAEQYNNAIKYVLTN